MRSHADPLPSWTRLAAGVVIAAGLILATDGVVDAVSGRSTLADAPRLTSGDSYHINASRTGTYTLFRLAPEQTGKRRRVSELRAVDPTELELWDRVLGLTVYPHETVPSLSYEAGDMAGRAVMAWTLETGNLYEIRLGGPAGQRFALIPDAADVIADAEGGFVRAGAAVTGTLAAVGVVFLLAHLLPRSSRRRRRVGNVWAPHVPGQRPRPVAREGVVALPYGDIAPRFEARRTTNAPARPPVLPVPPEQVPAAAVPAFEQVWEEPSLDHSV